MSTSCGSHQTNVDHAQEGRDPRSGGNVGRQSPPQNGGALRHNDSDHCKSILTLRARVDKTWNGRIDCVSRSNATTSPSRMQDLTLLCLAVGNMAMRSGYLGVWSSALREKIRVVPSSKI